MSFISKSSFKSKRRFSRVSKIRKTIFTLKHERRRSYQKFKMDSLSEDSFKIDGSEWTVNVLKANIKQRILESTRRLKRSDSWLLSMENDEIKNAECINPSEANTAFLWAAYIGKFDLMKFFQTQGANVSYANEQENFNALHLSALNGSVECCKWLYENGCPVLQTVDGLTPMHFAVFNNSKDVLEFLVEKGCCIPDTVINSAVCANAAECVKLLLSLCVDVNAYHEGMTPLHIATDLRRIECMKELLNHPSINVDLKTEPRGYTALHLAAENGYADCLELLLNKHARVGEVNLKLQTALHLACKGSHLDCVEMLLENRTTVNEVDVDLKTPLHAAISKTQQSMDIVKLLVHWKAIINVSDRYGYTPLHLAALNEFEECATYLISNGANVAAETKTGLTALNMICRKIPGSVPAIWKRLTQSLAYNSEQSLKFNFRELVVNSRVGEMGFLYTLQKEGHKEILQHPLCKAFLHLKWQKIKWYYFFRVLLVLITACLVSFVVVIDFANNCGDASKNSTDADNKTLLRKVCMKEYVKKLLNPCIIQYLRLIMSFVWSAMIALTILNIIRKLSCIVAYSSLKDYFCNHLNVIELTVTLTVLSLCVEISPGFDYIAGTAAVLLSWIYLTLTIGQLPFFGTYITMFKKVLKELLKLLSVYFCLLIGFTITFLVIFPTKAGFKNPIIGFVKTLSMMTGELNTNDITEDSDLPSHHDVALYCVLTLFIILVTMALMNLLIGIAVSDVEGLQKTADVSKLVHQTQLMYFLELAFFHGYIPKKFTNCFKKRVFVWPNLHKVVIYVRPLNSQEERIPKDVMLEAMTLALNKHKRNPSDEDKLGDISRRIESLENRISELCDKLLK